MDYEERRMRGETYEPGGSIERAGEQFEEGAGEFRRGMRGAQRQAEQMGRGAMTATRERMYEWGRTVNLEPRWMWWVGMVSLIGGVIAWFTFFTPRRRPMRVPQAKEMMWKDWMLNLGDRIVKFGNDLRSMSR